MTPAADIHDDDYDNGPSVGERLSEIDARLFENWYLVASKEIDPMKRCKMYGEMCEAWLIARKSGHVLYNRENYRK